MESHPALVSAARPLVIVGASARALAASAHRAGWSVYAADLFRDLDLVAVAQRAVRVTPAEGGYPLGLVAAAAGFPGSAPCCYTGGLENHPHLLTELAAARPLAGNPAEVVGRIRDPAPLATAVTAAGLAFPETHLRSEGLPTDGSYVVKPLASAGGQGIRPWTATVAASWPLRHQPTERSQHVWQRFIAGSPMSAGYVMSSGSARMLGIARQCVGSAWCHAPRFAWCGGVTDPRPDLVDRFERLGTTLAEMFRPVGMIGVDAMVDADGRITVLEVNPRPTASMELFERSTGVSIAALHLGACGHDADSDLPRPRPHGDPGRHWAKGVLFAARDVAVTPPVIVSLRRIAAEWTAADGGWPALADIPAPGQIITAGSPACTLFGRGCHPDDALDLLRVRIANTDRLLAAAAPCGQTGPVHEILGRDPR